MAWGGYDAILGLVCELPNNVAAQCNPSNPHIALDALKAEWTGILCEAGERTPRGRKSGRLSPRRQIRNDFSLCVNTQSSSSLYLSFSLPVWGPTPDRDSLHCQVRRFVALKRH